MSKRPELEFDEATHTYRVSGLVVPNVTRVLDPLVDWSRVPEDVLEHARHRGTAVHRATELFNAGTLDRSTLTNEIRPYLDAYVKFMIDTGFVPFASEKRVYCHRHRFAGTVDVIGVLRGEEVMIDKKARYNLGPETALQTAAYEFAGRTGGKKRRRYGLQLRRDGEYRLQEYTDAADLSVFLSALNLYNWRLANGC